MCDFVVQDQDFICQNTDQVADQLLMVFAFLVAGCDGAKPGRNYYTEFVKQTPSDSIVLTLACGKFVSMIWIWEKSVVCHA